MTEQTNLKPIELALEDFLRRFGVIESDPDVFWGSISSDMSNARRHASETAARTDLDLGHRVFKFEMTRDPIILDGVEVKITEIT